MFGGIILNRVVINYKGEIMPEYDTKEVCPVKRLEAENKIEDVMSQFNADKVNKSVTGLIDGSKNLIKVADVTKQAHYTQFKIQPATFIAANDLDYFQGNVIKYVMRYKMKNGREDLEKAKFYIDMMIQLVDTGEVKL